MEIQVPSGAYVGYAINTIWILISYPFAVWSLQSLQELKDEVMHWIPRVVTVVMAIIVPVFFNLLGVLCFSMLVGLDPEHMLGAFALSIMALTSVSVSFVFPPPDIKYQAGFPYRRGGFW
jgi:hypothetical protein